MEDVDEMEMWAFIGLLILAGMYKSQKEARSSLWDKETDLAIFRSTMSRRRFYALSNMIYFGNKLTRPAHQPQKLAAFRDLWETWESRLSLLFNPGTDVCVNEQLVLFRGCLPFRRSPSPQSTD